MHNSFCNFPEKCFKLLRSFFRSNLETPSLSHSAPWDPMFIISKLVFFVSHIYSTWNQLSPRSLCFLCRPMQWWLFFFLSWWWHPTTNNYNHQQLQLQYCFLFSIIRKIESNNYNINILLHLLKAKSGWLVVGHSLHT